MKLDNYMSTPLVSIIVPVYNHSNLISETLDSVLAQTHANWECIIIIDGSIDNTKEIVLKYCRRDNRFIHFSIERSGPSVARNLGLKVAKGDYIQFLDADDMISCNKFEHQIKLFIDNKPDAVVSSYDLFQTKSGNYFDDRMSSASPILTLDGFIYHWDIDFVITIHSPLISHHFIKQNNIKFSEEIKAKVDWVFWIELALSNATFYFHHEKMAHYRRHSTNMTSNHTHMILNNFKAIFLVYDLLSEEQKIRFREQMPMPLLLKSKELLGVYSLEMKITELKHSLNYKLGAFLLRPYRYIKYRIFRKHTHNIQY